MRTILGLGLLAASLSPAQQTKAKAATESSVVTVEQPDAQRTREELGRLLEHYPPTLRNVFSLDPTLLSNQTYLAPYPALISFLNAHPEIVRSPAFYIGPAYDRNSHQENSSAAERLWGRLLENLSIFAGFAMAVGLLTWLIRTLVDYRRWNRLTKVQTDVHTKILDRFTGHEELLNYIKSPAGAKFLESSPIALDASPRSIGAPLGRILFSVQAGLVLTAGGVGLDVVGGRLPYEAAQPINALGILGIALGLGFVISAVASYVISQRLGLIETPPLPRVEPPISLGNDPSMGAR